MAEVIQQCEIGANPNLAFQFLTQASDLREWFCDRAYTKPQAKGRYWLRWHNGYKIEGHYIQVAGPTSLAFVWQAPDAPAQTAVSISLTPVEKGVRIKLVHSGFGSGPQWQSFSEQCTRRWSEGLANLRSVLETGIDLRQAQRACLGITWSQADGAGIRVLQVQEGYGAEAKELQPDDVIVAVGERRVSDYSSFVEALECCQPGSVTTLLVMRQGVEQSVTVRLGVAPKSEMVLDARSVLARVRNHQIRMQRLLSDTLSGTTEREAGLRPRPDAWSVKETLAHLSVAERCLHHQLVQMILRGWDDTSKGNAASLPEALASTMSRADTLPRLLDRFAQDQAETLALFGALRPSIVAQKARYRRLAEALDMSEHTLEHINQIAETLKAVREQLDARRQAETQGNSKATS
mgnify:CR=1 FL=1